jgi:hypothetical protein
MIQPLKLKSQMLVALGNNTNDIQQNPLLRFPWGTMDLDSKVSEILPGRDVTKNPGLGSINRQLIDGKT